MLIHIERPKQEISWSGASGFSNKEHSQILKINQPVLIASNTKTYVAATILRLVEENKLKLDELIEDLLTEKTVSVLKKGNYNTSAIQISHLLSHTSGINNYVDADLFNERLATDPSYKWTRDEQIELAVTGMDRVGEVAEYYKYSDTNYLLLSEIIEEVTDLEYFAAIRHYLAFEKNGLYNTWFDSLEKAPSETEPLAHQYISKWGIDSYNLDKSFDLYGGGGLAATSSDLSQFMYKLFNQQVFQNAESEQLILTKIATEHISTTESDYRFGLWVSSINGYTAYGHGGFWGSMVYYFPELDLSLSVVILERDKSHLRKEVAQLMVQELTLKDSNN